MLKEIRQDAVVKPGGVIELASTELPAGTAVKVIVLVGEEIEQSGVTPEDEEKWADFDKNVVGAWKDDEEINQIFLEIERDRHRPSNRETPVFEDGLE